MLFAWWITQITVSLRYLWVKGRPTVLRVWEPWAVSDLEAPVMTPNGVIFLFFAARLGVMHHGQEEGVLPHQC